MKCGCRNLIGLVGGVVDLSETGTRKEVVDYETFVLVAVWKILALQAGEKACMGKPNMVCYEEESRSIKIR